MTESLCLLLMKENSVAIGGDTYTAGVANAAPIFSMGRQPMVIAAPTLTTINLNFDNIFLQTISNN